MWTCDISLFSITCSLSGTMCNTIHKCFTLRWHWSDMSKDTKPLKLLYRWTIFFSYCQLLCNLLPVVGSVEAREGFLHLKLGQYCHPASSVKSSIWKQFYKSFGMKKLQRRKGLFVANFASLVHPKATQTHLQKEEISLSKRYDFQHESW